MTVVLGAEAQGAETATGFAEKKGIAIRVEATATCKVKTLKLKTTAGSGKVILGLRKDSAGAVGAIMSETAEVNIGATCEGELAAEQEIVKGTFYWLCFVQTVFTVQIKVKSAPGECKKTTATITKLSEGTWTGAQAKYNATEPGFWAEEVVSASVSEETMML